MSVNSLLVILLCLAVAPTVHGASHDEEAGAGPAEYGGAVNSVFQSNLVFPQGQGDIQLSSGLSFGDEGSQNTWAAPFAIEYGLTNSLTLGLGIEETLYSPPAAGQPDGEGWISLSAQYSWLGIGGMPFHAGIGVGADIRAYRHGNNTPSIALDNGSTSALAPYAIIARDLPGMGDTHIFAHGGVSFEGGDSETFLNLGTIIPFESNVISLEMSFEGKARYVTPGVIFYVANSWELGFAASVGLNDEASRLGAHFSLVHEY